MPAFLRRLLSDERARFLVIGGINTVVAYGLFAAFEAAFGGRYLLSLLLSYLVATMLAFVLHRRFTFALSGRASIVADFLRFESVYVVMLAANAVLLPLLVELAGWSSLAAQAAIIIVTTIMSYLGHKFFSFRRPRPRARGGA